MPGRNPRLGSKASRLGAAPRIGGHAVPLR